MAKKQDKKILAQFYKDLLQMEEVLFDLDHRYPTAKSFHKTIKRQIRELDKIRHEFIAEIKQIEETTE